MTDEPKARPNLSGREPSRRRERPGSLEIGESSWTPSAPDFSGPSHDDVAASHTTPPASHNRQGRDGTKGLRSSPRSHKHRSSGAFLLQDAVENAVAETEQGHRRKKSRNTPTDKGKGRLSDKVRYSLGQDKDALSPSSTSSRQGTDSPGGSGKGKGRLSDKARYSLGQEKDVSSPSATSLRQGTDSPEVVGDDLAVPNMAGKRLAFADEDGEQQPVSAPMDADSTEIVNMALNLSESRRMASRRTSQANPPRLTPVPDTSPGSSLRQHLQQQRRTSRNLSPRPGLPKSPSGQQTSSPLQSGSDPNHASSVRWNFSSSTLARAEKARNHMELLAEQWRLLEMVPPLKPRPQGSSGTSPPSTPNGPARATTFGSTESNSRAGRKYNPLQYIRNRKVRARERKTVDGEAQGFGHVTAVREWVDEIASVVEGGGTTGTSSNDLPSFGPDASQGSPESTTKAVSRPKRPRVDWVVDPADMIADIYWLAQDDNKQLIEDRQWQRIFPQPVETAQSSAAQSIDSSIVSSGRQVRKETHDEAHFDPKPVGYSLPKTDTDLSHSSTRERARQKLHDIKGFHHRHNGSGHGHHDFLRTHRVSHSDTSDSELDAKITKRNRSQTITSNSKDILEKQMVEMVEKEAHETKLKGIEEEEVPRKQELEDLKPVATPMDIGRKPSSRFHSRKTSLADASESDDPVPRPLPFTRSPRPSLEIPSAMRRSSFGVEPDSSVPNTPDMRPTRGWSLVPAIGMDLSPPVSRPGSPSRNPITKVRKILRDRSRDRILDFQSDVKTDGKTPGLEGISSPTATDTGLEEPPVSRVRSRSPNRKLATRHTIDSGNPRRSIVGGLRRGDEQGMGGKSSFKGARIDNVLRGGVSKLSDFLWRKEALYSTDAPSEDNSSDESDGEQGRGRRREAIKPFRTLSGSGRSEQRHIRSYLDAVKFQPTAEAHGRAVSESAALPSPPPLSRTSSQGSTRFEQMKLPRIDVRSPSGTSSIRKSSPRRDSDISDAEYASDSQPSGVANAAERRINSMISLPPTLTSARRTSLHSNYRGLSSLSESTPINKREVSRFRALILSSGILAMEISRRANEPRTLHATDKLAASQGLGGEPHPTIGGISWPEISRISPESASLYNREVTTTDMYPMAAQALGLAIKGAESNWQASADEFHQKTMPQMQRRMDAIKHRVAVEFSSMAHEAAELADETNKDLVVVQRLKIRRVIDVIEKMLRRRRRRFRWVRRGMWLTVEWALVGFMWYVWFVVTILRVVFGVGRGVITGVRWLLWL